MNNKFAYVDEDDKCYGLTGMVISLNIWDKYSMLREITLDGDTSISFTPDFYFDGNPRMSAKIAWNEMLRQYQLMVGMVVSNILCRYQVRNRKRLTADVAALIRAIIEEEGVDICSLEKDEIDTLFNKTYGYLADIYRNPQIGEIANGFASTLKRRRTMSGNEVEETLEMLRMR